MATTDLLDDLDARGLIHDTTDRAALASRLDEGPITLYHGIDPTADSLHIGNLLGLVMLRRFLDAGHHVIALAGGATGMIGDPSGRSEERNLLDEATLRANVDAIKAQITRVLGADGGWHMVDNHDWTRDVTLLEFLRDVGKHMTVNQMVARESVKQRMQGEHGISFTEFSYMLLQAYDFWWLHGHEACELQIGGSDQWGNILGGVDLIRRRSAAAAHALCWPLLTAPDGSKLGKSTGGRVWLDAGRTSPFELFQHFMQVDDRQVRQQLCWFTLLPVIEIDAIVAAHEAEPERRDAQRRLALEVTAIVHGRAAAEEAAAAAATSFSKDANLTPASLSSMEGTVPTSQRSGSEEAVELLALLVACDLVPSKSAARRLVEQGGVYVNEESVADPAMVIGPESRISGRWLLLRAGKKRRHLIVFSS
jgi:tyrosyl-tRNA synthetase